MTQLLLFENPGEIDPRLIGSFGVNVKDDPSTAFGFFGTGLKYALAILLRTGHEVTIQSGLTEHRFEKRFGTGAVRAAPLTAVEAEMLRRAREFVISLGYADLDLYPLDVVESLGGGDGFRGLARDGRIYVAKRCFLVGTKYLAATILEEYLHLKFGFVDESRPFQEYLFDKVVSLGEQLKGEPL